MNINLNQNGSNMALNIVYIDDEVELGTIFAEIFSSPDVLINIFSTPESALEHIRKNSANLVFIDFRLNGTTGDQVALKMDPAIPKVLVTGDLNVRTIYPFKHVFNKPFDIGDVQQYINQFNKIEIAG